MLCRFLVVCGGIAQLAEQKAFNLLVLGSNPNTLKKKVEKKKKKKKMKQYQKRWKLINSINYFKKDQCFLVFHVSKQFQGIHIRNNYMKRALELLYLNSCLNGLKRIPLSYKNIFSGNTGISLCTLNDVFQITKIKNLLGIFIQGNFVTLKEFEQYKKYNSTKQLQYDLINTIQMPLMQTLFVINRPQQKMIVSLLKKEA